MKLSLSNLPQFLLFLVGLLCTTGRVSTAQVTSDNTVNTLVNQSGNVAEITGGETRGDNLFHSFQDFSIPANNEAFFDNANDISNIFSRVTGGNISTIEGEIRANGNASLFLINPAGIIFSEGASLNIGGSFYGSTASSILFEDGEFSAADLDSPPLLTVNAPIGLGFRDNPGDIKLNPGSQLGISLRENLALVGGNVSFDNAFVFSQDPQEPGATIELGGLTEAGTVDIEANGSLSFPENVARGDVSLMNDSAINLFSTGESAVLINARNFEMNSDAQIFNSIVSSPDSTVTPPGNTVINATEDIVIDGANSNLVIISSDIFASEPAQAGKIILSGTNISLVDGGLLSSTVANTTQGRSSNITLTAKENITLSGIDGFIRSGISNEIIRGAAGDSGSINITAKNLKIAEGAVISSSITGIGNSSDINIKVDDTVNIDAGSEFLAQAQNDISTTIGASGEGNSGTIDLETKNLSLANGGNITTGTFGEGISGNISITADIIIIDGELSEITSATFTDLIDFSQDELTQSIGGNLSILTNSLSITNGGELSTSTQSIGDAGNIKITARDSVVVDGTEDGFFSIVPSIIKSDVEFPILSDVEGNSGNIEINTPKLIVTNEGVISASTFANGNAGNLIINASESVEMNNDSVIQTEVFQGATGQGGNLDIETANLRVSNGAQVSASTRGSGDAGNLTIRATDSIKITGETETGKTALLATALEEDGRGGGLSIFTQSLTVGDNAVISVGNFPTLEGLREPGTGEAGNLSIQANSINLENSGSITAATQSSTGQGANIALKVADNIVLRDNGLISAQAINEGNGGNLAIDTNFIIAFPDGNSDIIASAQQGQGGNITINADSLLGIAERALSDLTNDINASSEFSLDGSITINTPDINPIQGTVELPSNIVVPEQTSAQACQANREIAAQNGFTIRGKGGVPPAPELPFPSQNVYVEDRGKAIDSSSIPEAIETSSGMIQPARGIKVTKLGIVLTAYRTNNTGDRLLEIKLNCDS